MGVPAFAFRVPRIDAGRQRPDTAGSGRGAALILAALDLGVEGHGIRRFGATIAAFNVHAQKAAERVGFRATGRFVQPASGREWVQFVAECQ